MMEFLHLVLHPSGPWLWPVWMANGSGLLSLVAIGTLLVDRIRHRRR